MKPAGNLRGGNLVRTFFLSDADLLDKHSSTSDGVELGLMQSSLASDEGMTENSPQMDRRAEERAALMS